MNQVIFNWIARIHCWRRSFHLRRLKSLTRNRYSNNEGGAKREEKLKKQKYNYLVFLYVHVKICRCYLFLVLQTPYKLLILSFLSLFVISFPSSSQMQWQSRFSNISFFLSLFLDICIRYLLECLPFLILSYLHLFINFVKFRYFL